MTPKKPMGRPRGTTPPPRYTVRLPASLVSPDQRDRVEQEAQRRGITLAELIRRLIDENCPA